MPTSDPYWRVKELFVQAMEQPAGAHQAEHGRDDRELDFVMFLDAVPAENRARLATEDDFLATIHRHRAFNE